jgi:hypothetical protein
MDSRQLLSALHEAQNKAGGRPVNVAIQKAPKKPRGFIAVSFNAAPAGRDIGELLKPQITITHNA